MTAVPANAVIDSGTRQVVLVAKGEGRFEPRAVKLGRRGDGYVEIVDGLKVGEEVVTSATFLIDAESNLRRRCKASAKERSHDRRTHPLVGAQRVSGRTGHDLRNARRHLRCLARAARRHPRPLRRAGHRLHRISRPGAAGGRGPGHLSADHGDADRAEIAGRARLLLLRRVLRLRDLRGRHRPLLGALARARISELCRAASAGGRDPEPRARRDRRRLGLSIRGARRAEEPRRAAHHPGLVHPLRPRQGRRRGRGRERRRLRQAVQRRHRSAPAAGARHPAVENSRRHPRQQHGCRRPHGRGRGDRVRRARPRLHQEPRRPRADRGQERRRRAGAAEGRGPRRAHAGRAARHHRDERRRRGRLRHRAAALRRECAVGHPEREGPARRDGAEPARGRERRGGLRPLRPDLPRHRHAQADADRGERHRRARLRHLPAACAQRAGRHHHAAARRADRLYLHVALGAELQHHEPRRHRHRHRRHGRCRHRHDRERPQASGARAARTSRAARC